AIDTPNIYEIPLVLHDEGLDAYIGRVLGLPAQQADLGPWRSLVHRVETSTTEVRIGLVGKYVNLPDAYLSVVEALKHGGYTNGAKVIIDWIASEDAEGLLAEGRLHDLDGIAVPGGFGARGLEGQTATATATRSTPATAAGWKTAGSAARAPRPTTGSSSSWS